MTSIDLTERGDAVVDALSVIHQPPAQLDVRRSPVRPGGSARPVGIAAPLLWTLAAITGLALWFVFHALVLTPIEEHGSQTRLYGQFREQLANQTAPLGGSIKPGSPVALLDSGAGGLRDLVVVEGTTAGALAEGPGHMADTPLPGQAGVSVIFGRSVTFGAPFRPVMRMRAGERITVTTAQGVFTYRVEGFLRPGGTVLPIPPGTSHLLMVTSSARGWRSGWAPDRAVYLDASLTEGHVQPTPPGGPAIVSKGALPMQGDTSVLVVLVLWLEAVILVAGGFAWAWIRWGRWQTWLAGVPVMLAVLWGASGAALRLLPNLI